MISCKLNERSTFGDVPRTIMGQERDIPNFLASTILKTAKIATKGLSSIITMPFVSFFAVCVGATFNLAEIIYRKVNC